MKTINTVFTDDEYAQIVEQKKLSKKSWHDFLYARLSSNKDYDKGFTDGKEYHRRMGDDNPFIEDKPAANGRAD